LADAGAASDLIDSIEQVDDVETHGHRLGVVWQKKFAPIVFAIGSDQLRLGSSQTSTAQAATSRA
jgi:hypothetical protein